MTEPEMTPRSSGPAVVIRQAGEADVAEILAMIGELASFEHMSDDVVCTPEGLHDALFGPDGFVRVSLATLRQGDGDDPASYHPIAGMALWFPTFSTFLGRPGIWLEDLFVRPAHRRLGVARALLSDLRRRTSGRVEWDVLEWNRGAIDLYRSVGARPVEGWTRFRWSDPA